MIDTATPLQAAKLAMMNIFPLARDGYHIYIGFVVFILTLVFSKKSLRSLASLLPVLLVAVVIEVADLRDDLATFGYFRFQASAWDIMNTVLIPLVLVLLAKKRTILNDSAERAEGV